MQLDHCPRYTTTPQSNGLALDLAMVLLRMVMEEGVCVQEEEEKVAGRLV